MTNFNNTKFTVEGAIMNFIYFLLNHPGFYKVIEEAFAEKGENFIEHCKHKVDDIMGEDQICRPEHIVKFITGLSTDNQLLFVHWVSNNYDSKFPQFMKDAKFSKLFSLLNETDGEIPCHFELDNLDEVYSIQLENGEVVVENEHGTTFPFSDLSDTEKDVVYITLSL